MKFCIVNHQEIERLAKVVAIFNHLFAESENTILVTGAVEPLYKAPTIDSKGEIHSREDYLSSALHELAHWTIAGEKRRQIDDFGYWYEEEGRTIEQQLQFEKVEVKPQAVEWILSLACFQRFHFSADNLSQKIGSSAHFKHAVCQQARDYIQNGLPQRAENLFKELKNSFGNDDILSIKDLEIENA